MERLNIYNRRYLGSKYKLTGFISEIVNENCKNCESFFDVFAGTGVVAHIFNSVFDKIIVNDILKSNYFAYNVWFSHKPYDNTKIDRIIDEYNGFKPNRENYFSKNFANSYFSKNDCIQIGSIRNDIEEKYRKKLINLREKYILVSALIYSADRVANTVGHYDAYRKLSVIEDKFKMYKLEFPDNNINVNNEIYNKDSNLLVNIIKADIFYIDPPYNSRQYSDAYHLLENLADWKKPKVYGIAKKMDRSHIKSPYCTNKAGKAFFNLICNANTKYILISYNNMGKKGDGRSQAKINDKEIIESLERKGKVSVFEKEFNFFTTGKTSIDNHKERVFLCEVGKKHSRNFGFGVVKSDGYVKSPLNYVGGKYKLLDQIVPLFPKNIGSFVDMFCGGCNVGINVKANNYTCVDKQKELVRILNLFKSTPWIDIVGNIEKIINGYKLSNSYLKGYKYYNCDSSKGLGLFNKEKYIKLRQDFNEMDNNDSRWEYYLITLIVYSFNHQIRFNSKGEYNMPVGKRDFNSSIRKNLLKFLERITNINIEFINLDFRNFNLNAYTEKDFFYFDPPYYLGMASYNENYGWSDRDEDDLLNYIDKLNKKSIRFGISNVIEHKGEKHEKLIKWSIDNKYNLRYLKYDYNNSNYHSQSKFNKTCEVMITNY